MGTSRERISPTMTKPTLSLLALPTYGPSALRLSRLQQHLASIADDDTLLARESFGQALTQIELRDALEERGMCVPLFLNF